MKLTQAAARDAKMPAGEDDYTEFFDGKPGFGLRLRKRPDGTVRRSYVYQYKIGPSHFKITIGDAGKLRLADAIDAMEIHVGEIAKGRNPAVEKRKDKLADLEAKQAAKVAAARKPLSEHVRDFLDARQVDTKPRSWAEMKRLLEKDYWKPIHGLDLDKVDGRMVSQRIDHIVKHHGRVAASHARIALSSLFKWCVERHRCAINPVIGTQRPSKPEARERVLTDAELAAVWNNAPASDYGPIVRLLTLTGQRRDEIASLRWSELKDLDDASKARIELAGERTKNGKPHDVPLSADALAILKAIPRRAGRDLVFGEGEGGFSGWSAAKTALDTACGVKAWRLHDLRRTAATRMADSGVLPHIIEAVLNHISGSRASVAGVYNRAVYAAEKRAALDTLASYIKTALAKAKGANVHRLKRA